MWSSKGRLAWAIACGLAIAVAPAAAMARSSKIEARAKSSRAGGRELAQSIGAPNNGRLVGAARLRGGRTLRQREGGHSWGLPQLVHLLHHTAGEVAKKHRGSQMLVGDLSGRTGGHLDRHNSHQTGRDADVGFYVMNSKGKPMAVKRFIPFDEAGNARDVPGARFDEARNWTMVVAMLKDERASVRYMFISNGLRAKLLAHAARKHVPRELIERAASVMMSPRDADLHDDHVHVRIACPESMREVCVEESSVREAPAKVADADAGATTDPAAAPTPAAAPAPAGRPEAPKVAESGAGDAK